MTDTMAAWQRSIPIETLREHRAVFAAFDAGYVHGAFGAAKENSIAEWLDKGRLHASGPSRVVARHANQKSRIVDFTGEQRAVVPAGAFIIDRMASPDLDHLAGLLAGLLDNEPVAVVNAWAEHPDLPAVLAGLGLERSATKIRASSDMTHVWTRGVDVQQPEQRDLWTLRPLPFTADPAALAAEVSAAEPAWEQHYSSYNKRRSWTAVSLRSFGGDQAFIEKPAEMSKGWRAEHPDALRWRPEWTPLADQLPACRTLVASLGCDVERVRLMRLAAGSGELTRHADITDRDAGTAPGRIMRLHFPIETNADVVFTAWDAFGQRSAEHMTAGSCCRYTLTTQDMSRERGGRTEHIAMPAADVADLLDDLRGPGPR